MITGQFAEPAEIIATFVRGSGSLGHVAIVETNGSLPRGLENFG